MSDLGDVLTLDEETHRYYLGRQRIPSVSEVLRQAGLQPDYGSIPSWILSRAAARGTAVHEHANKIITGGFDILDVDEECEPYVDAFISWLVDNGGEDAIASTVYAEEMLCVDRDILFGVQFAGTVDWVFEFNDGYMIIDFKTSKKQSIFHHVQVEAYIELVKNSTDSAYDVRGGVLYLSENGEHELVDTEPTGMWSHALTTFSFKMRHGEIGGYKRKKKLSG